MRTIVKDADSPIELPDEKHRQPYWIHAPGHAWARFDFDPRKGGAGTVELSSEPAIVDVNLAGARATENARVRLYPDVTEFEESGFRFRMPERPPHYLAAVSVGVPAGGSVRISDLQAGKYLAAVEVGEYEETLRLGQTPVEVAPGGHVSLTLAIDPSALEVPRTHIHGTIEVPEGLDRRLCTLHLRRIGEGEKPFSQSFQSMSFNHGDDEVLHWDAGSLRTGDYVARVSGIEHQELIHASGPNETSLVIRIPPLTTIFVDAIDADTGRKIDPERVRWMSPRVEGVAETFVSPALRMGTDGRYRIVSARGDIRISCEARGYEDASLELTLDRPELSRTIPMHRARDSKDR